VGLIRDAVAFYELQTGVPFPWYTHPDYPRAHPAQQVQVDAEQAQQVAESIYFDPEIDSDECDDPYDDRDIDSSDEDSI
jgi:hypothetical protein